MVNIKIIYMHQSCDVDPFVTGPPIKIPKFFSKPNPYTLSFKLIECPDGITFRALLKKLPSLDSAVLHLIRGRTAERISQDEDFPLCDGDILHITDHFSMTKRILEMVF